MVNKTTTFSEMKSTKRRPRFSIQEMIVDKLDIQPCVVFDMSKNYEENIKLKESYSVTHVV